MLEVKGKQHCLAQGDTAYFDLAMPHRWFNKSSTVARVLLVNPKFTPVEEDLPVAKIEF